MAAFSALQKQEVEPLLIIDDVRPRFSEHFVRLINDEKFASQRESAVELEDKLEALKRQVGELHKAVLGGRELNQEINRLEGRGNDLKKPEKLVRTSLQMLFFRQPGIFG